MRTVVGYISKYLNKAASNSPTFASEPVTGAPFPTGVNLGAFQEFDDAQAARLSNPAGNTLYSGVYIPVMLDPNATGLTNGLVPVGTPLYWLQSAGNAWTVTTVASGNFPDFAGISIDPGFGTANPYAWIQSTGKATVQYQTAAFTNTGTKAYGDVVGLNSSTPLTFDDLAAVGGAAPYGLAIGIALAIPVVNTAGLIRITRAQGRL